MDAVLSVRRGLSLSARLSGDDLARFLRFCVVGALTAGVYMAALNGAALVTGWPVAAASLLAYPVTIAFNYVLHRFWTFPDRHRDRGEMVRYAMVVVGCGLMNALLLNLRRDLGGLQALAYEFAVMGLIVAITFATMNLWVWKRPAA